MQIDTFIRSLQLHSKEFPSDSSFVDRSIEWIKNYGEFAFDKENLLGHFTWSMMIVNHDRTKVLLMLHKKFQRWQQFGGHCDGETDVRGVALREFHEESGIMTEPRIIWNIFFVAVHNISLDAKGRPPHLHFDVIYLGEIDEWTLFSRQEDEVDDIRWFSIEGIEEFVDTDMAQRIARIKELKT